MTNHEDQARAATEQSQDPSQGPARARTISEPGALLAGRYRILRTLASGGMGTVYEGEHALLGHRIAIKMLHPQYAHSEASTKRFMNEARAAAQLRHPHIARCDDIGVTPDGHPFLVLELLSGRDLCDELGHTGPCSVARTLEVGRQVASALGHAHAQGIVHRDMKPENVFLARTGSGSEQVKVLDFGVARFIGLEHTSGTRTGAAIGTPLYMAPEQFTDASRVDARADVYGLGVVLYEMLSGQRPYDAPTLPELLSRMAAGRFTPLESLRGDVPPHVARAIHACLAPDPSHRPADMEALLGMLEGSLAPLPVPAQEAPPAKRGSRTTLVLALLVLSGIAAGITLWWRKPPASVPAPAPVAAPVETPKPTPEVEAKAAVPEPVLEAAPAAVEQKPAKHDERAPRREREKKPATAKERAHPIADEPDF